MIREERDERSLREYYKLYKERGKDLIESEEEFLSYVEFGRVLTDGRYKALFIECGDKFCLVFYLIRLSEGRGRRGDFLDFFMGVIREIGLPLVGLRGDELWYFDSFIFIVYDLNRGKIKTKREVLIDGGSSGGSECSTSDN